MGEKIVLRKPSVSFEESRLPESAVENTAKSGDKNSIERPKSPPHLQSPAAENVKKRRGPHANGKSAQTNWRSLRTALHLVKENAPNLEGFAHRERDNKPLTALDTAAKTVLFSVRLRRAYHRAKRDIELEESNHLFDSRNLLRRANTISFVYAVIGIILMIVQNEISESFKRESTLVAEIVRAFISATTVMTILYVYKSYSIKLQILKIKNTALDDDTVFRSNLWKPFAAEIIILAIHVPPFVAGLARWDEPQPNKQGVWKVHPRTLTWLGIFMFARVYLLVKIFRDSYWKHQMAYFYSALNAIDLDHWFTLKTALQENPFGVLFCIYTCLLGIGSYSLYSFERNAGGDIREYWDALWLVFVSVTTVGYGDVAPYTHSGRFVLVMCVSLGLTTTAVYTAVVFQHVQLRRAERLFVYQCMKDKWRLALQDTAARTVQLLWRSYKRGSSRTTSASNLARRLFSSNAVQDTEAGQGMEQGRRGWFSKQTSFRTEANREALEKRKMIRRRFRNLHGVLLRWKKIKRRGESLVKNYDDITSAVHKIKEEVEGISTKLSADRRVLNRKIGALDALASKAPKPDKPGPLSDPIAESDEALLKIGAMRSEDLRETALKEHEEFGVLVDDIPNANLCGIATQGFLWDKKSSPREKDKDVQPKDLEPDEQAAERPNRRRRRRTMKADDGHTPPDVGAEGSEVAVPAPSVRRRTTRQDFEDLTTVRRDNDSQPNQASPLLRPLVRTYSAPSQPLTPPSPPSDHELIADALMRRSIRLSQRRLAQKDAPEALTPMDLVAVAAHTRVVVQQQRRAEDEASDSTNGEFLEEVVFSRLCDFDVRMHRMEVALAHIQSALSTLAAQHHFSAADDDDGEFSVATSPSRHDLHRERDLLDPSDSVASPSSIQRPAGRAGFGVGVDVTTPSPPSSARDKDRSTKSWHPLQYLTPANELPVSVSSRTTPSRSAASTPSTNPVSPLPTQPHRTTSDRTRPVSNASLS